MIRAGDRQVGKSRSESPPMMKKNSSAGRRSVSRSRVSTVNDGPIRSISMQLMAKYGDALDGRIDHGNPISGRADCRIGFVRWIIRGQKLDPVKAELITSCFGNDQVAVMNGIECATEETNCCHARFPCLPGRFPGSTV